MFFNFLDSFRCTEAPTHLAYGKFNGKFKIPEDKHDEFMKLYIKEIKNKSELNILECQKDYSKILIDIDIKINKDEWDNERLYDDDLIRKIGKLYIKAIKKNLIVEEDDLKCYLFEKQEPTIIKDKNIVKDGFHLMFPNIVTSKLIREQIYNDVLSMDESLKSVLDKAVINNGWFLYGSSKPNLKPYEVTGVYNYKMKVLDEKIKLNNIIKTCSIYGCNDTMSILENETIQQPEPIKKVEKEYKSNNNQVKNDDDDIKIILENLNSSRFDDYNDWLSMYMIFKNCNLDMSLFYEYSERSDKYNKVENDKILKNIQQKEGLTISTLYYWLKQDNLKVFKTLMSKNNDYFDSKVINNKDLAELYYNMNPEQYIYNKNFGWFVYNQYNVLESFKNDAPTSLLNDISNKLQDWLNTLKDSISLSDEKAQDKFKEIKKLINYVVLQVLLKVLLIT